MNKDNIPLLLLALALILAAIITFIRGGEKSRHGIGWNQSGKTIAQKSQQYFVQLT